MVKFLENTYIFTHKKDDKKGEFVEKIPCYVDNIKRFEKLMD